MQFRVTHVFSLMVLVSSLVAVSACGGSEVEGAQSGACSTSASCASGEICVDGLCEPDEADGASPSVICEPGETQVCVCPGGEGAQSCNSDGTGWEPCVCVGADTVGDTSHADGGTGPDSGPIEGGQFGDSCDEPDDCFSGLCVGHMGDEVCTKTCENECPVGWSCEQVALGGGDPAFVCVSVFEHLCQPCLEASDCESDTGAQACVSYGPEGSFCGAVCEENADCPEDFECVEGTSTRGGSSKQCVYSDGLCPCSDVAMDLGLSTECQITNEHGTCSALRTCAHEGLSACEAATPEPESCNGLDDNCDEEIDEGTMCDDADPCTTDLCEGAQGCTHTIATGAPCDDQDETTADDTCQPDGACFGSPIDCPEGPCVLEVVIEAGECVTTYQETGTACDDGDVTTNGDVCDGAGVCAGQTYVCPAPSSCTASYTQDGEGCLPSHLPAGEPCDDGSDSTAQDQCDGEGLCAGAEIECPEPTMCTPQQLKDGTGCVPQFADSGVSCDDGDVTTKEDTCNGAGSCLGTVYSCPSGSVCTPEYVQDGEGCVPSHANEGDACDDEDNGTKNDACDGAGACLGEAYTCGEPTDCTLSYTQNGVGCVANQATFGTPCDDENNETKNDECNGFGQCVGAEYECPQTSTCTPAYTKNGVDCTPNYAEVGVTCDDASTETKEDTCDGLGGCAGLAYACPDATACTPSYTKDGSDCLPNHAPAGEPCDDEDNTTKNDVCEGSGLCEGAPYSCPETTLCISSYTQDGADCVANHAPDGTLCGGDNECDSGSCEPPSLPVISFTSDLSANHSATAGDNHNFSVSAVDTANANSTVTYQWYLSTNGGGSFSPIGDAATDTLTRYNPFYASDDGHVIKARATVSNSAGTTHLDSTPCALQVSKKFECDGEVTNDSLGLSGGGHKPSGENGDQEWGSWSPGHNDICEVNGSTNSFNAGGRCSIGCILNDSYQGYKMQLELRITRSTDGTRKHWGDQTKENGSCGKTSGFQLGANGGGWNPVDDGVPTFRLMIIDGGTECQNGAGQHIFAESDAVNLDYTYRRGNFYFEQRP